MKRNSHDIDLENLHIEPVDIPHHRMELRRQLLASPYWQKRRLNWTSIIIGVKRMQKRTYIAAGVVICLVAAAIALTMALIPQNTIPVQAAVVAEKSLQAVTMLSQEQQGELAVKLQVGKPMDLLQKAKNAKDLKVLSYEQFASQNPLPPDGKTSDFHSFTFLQFTDTNGATITLGINPRTNLPEMVVASIGSPDGSSKPSDGAQAGGIVTSQDRGDDVQAGGIVTSTGNGDGAHFQWSNDQIKVEGTIHSDGTATFMVNGKSYRAPANSKFSIDEPPTVKVEGDDIYVNGIKLEPEK
jgi:hypothetical protein